MSYPAPNARRTENDDIPTPSWLKQFFKGWDDPAPLGGDVCPADGLLREWRDPAFVNIPYSRGNVDRWVDKAILEARRGIRVILLVRVDPSTKWWTRLLAAGAEFAPFMGRIQFDGQKYGTSRVAVALVFLGGELTSRLSTSP